MNVCVLDMQPISPAVGGGRLRLLGLYHALGADLPTTYIGTYDWPGEPPRDIQLTPGLREITVPLSPEHFAADARLRAEAGGKNVIDTAFHLFAHLSPEYLERTRRAASEADIVICAHPWVYPLVKDVVDRRRSLLVYDSHNCEGLLRISLLDDGGRGTEIAKGVISMERSFCQDADLILACSQEDLDLFHELYGVPCEKIRIVPNGVFVNALRPPTQEQRLRFRAQLKITHQHAAIFIGSGYQFNTEAARFIIQQVAPSLPGVLFVVAGGVGLTLKENGIADSIGDNVRITGVLSDEDRRVYLSACDIGLNPMFGGSGTNIKMFDYVAAGLPSVTTDIGARGIRTGAEPAFLVARPEDFVSHIELLTQYPSIWRQLSRSSRQVAKEFYSWERISANLGALLKSAHSRIGCTPKRFSVIIVASEHRHFEEVLGGLQKQTFRDFEIVLVDCSDLRWPEAEHVARSGVLYVQSDVRSPAALKNLGAFLASGDLITFLSAGFTPSEEWLASADPYFVHPDVVALRGNSGPDGRFGLIIRRAAFIRAGQFETHLQGEASENSLELRLRNLGAVLTSSQTPPAESHPRTPLASVSQWIRLSHEEFAATAYQLLQGLAPAHPRVRELAEELASGNMERSDALADIAKLSMAVSGGGINVAPLLPSVFLDESRCVYCLEDLLKPDGDAFVEAAYQAILNRTPDPAGFQYFSEALRMRALTKTEILKRLLGSDEAQHIRPHVIGLTVDLASDCPAGSIFFK
jgi:glycosyltransferase involved in cell wall biosynthesis